ncbi:hypothetical protein PtA15_14A219 [Puccinia triticina]|uniref:Uncharacterized protein n=1 Tax=Puccinia triticina TaxID=208348 RepID=A0ABY7D1P6_9BASI|nr:uncharacterized protein PtA15_14A219 [Puccinia triticina]WAQ91336.1 hypothetical protein PtA15_14A219 [Puccinia triticina]
MPEGGGVGTGGSGRLVEACCAQSLGQMTMNSVASGKNNPAFHVRSGRGAMGAVASYDKELVFHGRIGRMAED